MEMCASGLCGSPGKTEEAGIPSPEGSNPSISSMCLSCIENPLPFIDNIDKMIERLKSEGKERLAKRARQFQAKRIKEFYGKVDNTTSCSQGLDVRKAVDSKRYEISREI